jgi:RNA polymerase sigma-70 factor (ECF subfamily)
MNLARQRNVMSNSPFAPVLGALFESGQIARRPAVFPRSSQHTAPSAPDKGGSMKSQVAHAQMGALDRMSRPEELTVAELHERYLEEIFRYVWQRVSSAEEAEDITAEVFAAATTGLPRFRGQCPPYLWLLSIARRQIALARRRRAVRRETLASELVDEEPDGDAFVDALAAVDGPEATLMQAEARQVLGELLARLSADQREALMLQYMEQLSVAEIAVVMGRSPASVNSLLQRARATLYRRGRAYFLGDDEEQQR